MALAGATATDRRGHRHRLDAGAHAASTEVLDGPRLAPGQSTLVAGLRFEVGPGVFWQVHERGPDALVDAVLDGPRAAPGRPAW